MKTEICFIAPTENLAKRAEKIIRQKGLSISIYTAALDEAVKIAARLMKEGTWLFISRRGTKELLERELHTTVVNIPLEASDYIPVIRQVSRKNGPIAFFSAEESNNEFQTMCSLLDIDMLYFHCKSKADWKRNVEAAARRGAVWGIGGAVSEEYAREIGFPHTIVESSDTSILAAIETACQLYHQQKENEKKQELLEIELNRFKNILDYTHDAVIAIDGDGKITVVNRVAEKILNPDQKPFEGKSIDAVLPNTKLPDVLKSGKAETGQLINIRGTMVAANRVPVLVNGRVKGVVATFQDVKTLQKTERKIRIKLHEKGLLAKYRFQDIVGTSEAITAAKELAENFADSEFTVMLYGETGVGKEMFAQSIHNASPRRDGPFVAVNCTALSKNLLESELFGYVDGSFTGAKKGGAPGLFETAHGGTIFLDEIGDLPMEFQAQFLRVLQEKEVRRVGGDTVIPVDIRVIGATNRDLLRRVEEGKFRQDLYYRLNVLNIRIPSLKEREDDFLNISAVIREKIEPGSSAEEVRRFLRVMEHFRGYSWPGNVRELTNMTERIYLLQRRGMEEGQIWDTLSSMAAETVPEGRKTLTKERAERKNGIPLKNMEADYIEEALKKNGGNVSKTARELKISRSTLYRKRKDG